MGHRAFGIAPLVYQGKRTEAVKVGLAMTMKYIMRFLPNTCIVVWDGGHDRRRMKLFPEYKKKRKKLTEIEYKELKLFLNQIVKLQKCLKRLGIVQYRCERREADDVIYNLVMEMDKNFDGNHYIVVSTDKDFFQMFAYWFNLEIYSPQKDVLITKGMFEKDHGFSADYYVEYKALMGDVSDSLPGVKGIGPVWAKWLVNNVFEKEKPDGRKWDKEQKSMVDLMLKEEKTLNLMANLITFKDISKKELEAGRTEDRPRTIGRLQERALAICEKYGFKAFQDYFPQFLEPFEHLWRKAK